MRALLLAALLLAPARSFGLAGFIDFSTTEGFPSGKFPKGERFLLHKDADLGISLLRIKAGEVRGTYEPQADTLTLFLHPEIMHVYPKGIVKPRRGDFILDHAGEVNGAWRVDKKGPLEILLFAVPGVFPKKLSPQDVDAARQRGVRRGLTSISAARARIDKATGPARRLTVVSSPGLKIELLRLTASVELQNSTPSTAVLFPLDGAATLGEKKNAAVFDRQNLFLMGAEDSVRINPALGKPFYAILISLGS